jgi:hypothetical protein
MSGIIVLEDEELLELPRDIITLVACEYLDHKSCFYLFLTCKTMVSTINEHSKKIFDKGAPPWFTNYFCLRMCFMEGTLVKRIPKGDTQICSLISGGYLRGDALGLMGRYFRYMGRYEAEKTMLRDQFLYLARTGCLNRVHKDDAGLLFTTVLRSCDVECLKAIVPWGAAIGIEIHSLLDTFRHSTDVQRCILETEMMDTLSLGGELSSDRCTRGYR